MQWIKIYFQIPSFSLLKFFSFAVINFCPVIVPYINNSKHLEVEWNNTQWKNGATLWAFRCKRSLTYQGITWVDWANNMAARGVKLPTIESLHNSNNYHSINGIRAWIGEYGGQYMLFQIKWPRIQRKWPIGCRNFKSFLWQRCCHELS